MIRGKRVFIGINAAGAIVTLFGIVLRALYPSTHSDAWSWIHVVVPPLLFVIFVYNIVARLRGKQPPDRAPFGLSDRQMWLVKGSLIGVVLVVGVAFIVQAHH